jgi:hypothetical protein
MDHKRSARAVRHRGNGFGRVASRSKCNSRPHITVGCPILSAHFAERVGGENATGTNLEIPDPSHYHPSAQFQIPNLEPGPLPVHFPLDRIVSPAIT